MSKKPHSTMEENTPAKSKDDMFNSETSLVSNKRVSLSKLRWLLMGIFVMQETVLAFQYTQLSIINNVLVHYYNTSATLVEWTSQVYSLCCILIALPSAHLLNKIGARYMAIIASTIACVGTWIKLLAVGPDRFMLLMIGQVLESIAYAICYGMLALIPAYWFGTKEISFAGNLSVMGIQIGNTLGFLIPPLMVQDSPDFDLMAAGMRRMFFSIAVASTVILTMIIIFFESKPKNPASVAQAVQSDMQYGGVFQMWKVISKKPGFIIVALIWACNMSILNLVSTVLNELILSNFPDGSTDAGNIGFLLGACGIISSTLTSYILDRTRKFKEYSIFLTTGACISMILFTMSLKSHNITFVYISALLFGGFLIGSFCPVMQTCIEVTYPRPENIAIAILFIIGDVSTLVVTSAYSFIMKQWGDLIPNIILIMFLSLSVVLACSIPRHFERQYTENTGKLSNNQSDNL